MKKYMIHILKGYMNLLNESAYTNAFYELKKIVKLVKRFIT